MEIFLNVVKLGHLTHVAKDMGLSQSAISMSIKELESILTRPLFDRINKKLILNEVGRNFHQAIEPIFKKIVDIEYEFKNTEDKGTVRIGASTTIVDYLIPPIVCCYMNKYPDVKIQLKEGNTNKIASLVKEGKLDMAFVEASVKDNDIISEVIGFDELIGQPGDGVGFAASRRVLDEIAFAHTLMSHIFDELAHHIHLVIAREKEGAFGERIALFAVEPYEVLYQVGEASFAQDLFPEIGAFVAVGIGRIAFAVVVPFVERQKIGLPARQFRRHIDFVGIDGEMDDTPSETQQRLFGVALFAVLFLAVKAGVLPRPGVFELHRDDGNAVDEEHHIDLFTRVGERIGHLPRHAELVAVEAPAHFGGARRQRRYEHQGEMGVFHLQTLAQYPDDAVFFDHPIESLKDLESVLRIASFELFELFALGRFEKVPEAFFVDGVLFVEVSRLSAIIEPVVPIFQCGFFHRSRRQLLPAHTRQRLFDTAFERLLVGSASSHRFPFSFSSTILSKSERYSLSCRTRNSR